MTPLELVSVIVSSAGGIAAIGTGLVAWLGKVWSDRITAAQKQLADVDVDLRQHRLKVYPELWQLTAVLPKWPRDPSVTYECARKISEDLRSWYFERGGMFLSRTTHTKGYGPLQDKLKDVLGAGKTGPLSDSDYDSVQERCSILRTCLAGDIESRREGIDPKS